MPRRFFRNNNFQSDFKLSEKALDFYKNSTNIKFEIEEIQHEDFYGKKIYYTYDLLGDIDETRLTADEVNKLLEEIADFPVEEEKTDPADFKRLKIVIIFKEILGGFKSRYMASKTVTVEGLDVRERDHVITGASGRRLTSKNKEVKFLYKKPRARKFREITKYEAMQLGYKFIHEGEGTIHEFSICERMIADDNCDWSEYDVYGWYCLETSISLFLQQGFEIMEISFGRRHLPELCFVKKGGKLHYYLAQYTDFRNGQLADERWAVKALTGFKKNAIRITKEELREMVKPSIIFV